MTALDAEAVQGNVLRPYPPEFADVAFRFLQIRGSDDGPARACIAALLERVSFGTRPAAAPSGAPHVNVAFSFAGLQALGVPDDLLYAFPEDFRQGAAARASALGDRWPQRARALDEAHVLLTVHSRAPAEPLLPPGLEGLRQWHRRDAHRRTDAREGFGFPDGGAQPAVDGVDPDPTGDGVLAARAVASGAVGRRARLFAEDLGLRAKLRTWRAVQAGEFVLGQENEDGVLPDGPPAPLGPGGTFMVYRDMRQHVRRFGDYVDRQAAATGLDADELKAKIVGRRPDTGAPVSELPGTQTGADGARDVTYAGDPHGFGCPLHAHARRANPRDGLPGGGERTMRHRIIRRGVAYGRAGDDHQGLAFVGYASSISGGFEFILQNWLASGAALGLGDDADFLLQQSNAEGRCTSSMVIPGFRPVILPPPDAPFVTVRGCGYFFVPSRQACAWLAERLR